jgi:hypothetical protein
LHCEEHNDEVDAVLNVRLAEIDAKFGQVVKPPAALAAVEMRPDAPGGTVEQGDAARAKSPAAPGVSVEHAPAPVVSVEHGAGGDGTATKVATKRRKCSKTQCAHSAKEGSTYCERCAVEFAVHLEYFEAKSSCFRCKNTGTGAYCDRHEAELNVEVEMRMAKQKNEATADGAGGAKCTATLGDPVEEGAAVELVLCHRCGKKPVTDDCSDYCNDCIAKLGLA